MKAKEWINQIFQSTVLTANTVALLLLCLSAFSDRVPPSFSVSFSYLGLVFPFIVVINIFFLAWWLIRKRWKIALICVAGFIICSGSIYTYCPIHLKTKEIPSNCIKLLTYNTMQFEHVKPNDKKNPNGILQYIAKSKADIVCVQEYSAFTDNRHLNENDVKQALKDYPYSKVLVLTRPYNGVAFGLAIFSKFPILSFKEIDFESAYNGAFIVELDINGKRTTLINVHLESNKLSMEERSEYYEMTKDFETQKLDMFTSKMEKRLTPAYRTRAAQAKMVAKVIEESKNPYTIVCGDFNDTPISYVRKTVKGDLKDAFVESGNGLGISYNRYRFLFRIDHILHSKNIKAYNCTVDRIKYSDHYPVWTYLQLN